MKKIAVIDIGSNSFHLLVAEAAPDESFTPIERAKEMVRLGEKTLVDGFIPQEAFARAKEALLGFRQILDRHQNPRCLAYATSAVREAQNADDFIAKMRRETEIDIEIISAEEEGRLVYLGARQALDLKGRLAVIADIGGGSVELILADAEGIREVSSLPLGVLGLAQRYITTDPVSLQEKTRLSEHIDRSLESFTRRARQAGARLLVLTGGTARALKNLHSFQREGKIFGPATRSVLSLEAVCDIEQALSQSSRESRASLGGFDAKRADTIFPGALLIRALYKALAVEEAIICRRGLREGMLITALHQSRDGTP